ncbi:MAG: hypothetical protein J0H74_01205 [Chitinophagaceae bacterium]|nr:hypothetical protein [Chitinophagaceae bacterium]
MITRNNYEEFFLLYVDNELSPAEREAVEGFVEAHPDLREEWELLLQCRIRPDETPVFAGKELLLHEESPSLITLNNYESWFLSYIDGELDEPARQAVTQFIHRHPDKSVELQRLQRTVNIPDKTIVFPHKKTLYRREERRTAWLPFVRIAAAALVLGAIGLLVFHPFRNAVTPPIAKAPIVPSASGKIASTPDKAATLADATRPTEEPIRISADKKSSPVQPAIKKHLVAVTPHTADTLHLYKSKQPDDEETASATTTAEPALAKVDLPAPDKAIASVKVSPAVNTSIGNPDLPKVITRDPKTSFATEALLSHAVAYTEDGAIEEPLSPRKNKLRGIFRKVTRALEKPASRAEDDDRKVLIGGFQFALQ